MNTPHRFAIWGNTDKPIFWEILPEIFSWAQKKNLELYLTTRIIDRLNQQFEFHYQTIRSAEDFSDQDFVLALGGDGTFLSAARVIADRNVPILGIHLGDLGFLAKVTLADLYPRLNQVANGDYGIESRLVLACEVDNATTIKSITALNDLVIYNSNSHRMLACQLIADGRFVGNYKADGLIIATPTGSTAYSLSAGGPIVKPDVSSIIVTPICPHSLTSRPLVLSDSVELEIKFPAEHPDDAGITADGQIIEQLTPESRVVIRKADYSIPFITFDDTSYFQTLRTKMGWGQRGDGNG